MKSLMKPMVIVDGVTPTSLAVNLVAAEAAEEVAAAERMRQIVAPTSASILNLANTVPPVFESSLGVNQPTADPGHFRFGDPKP